MSDLMVSISCITFNQSEYVAETLESFLRQKTTFSFEILIHDDASTDGTADIISQYQKKYPEIIKPIIQKENQFSKGVKRIDAMFNIPRAKGKYIAICEGDDYWTDSLKLQKQVDYMEKHPKCGMCFHAASKVDTFGKNLGLIRPYFKSVIASTDDVILGGGAFIATNSILYRRELSNRFPDFYYNSPVGDYPLQMFLSSQEYSYYIDQNMSSYRVGVSGSWTNRIHDESFKKVENKKKHLTKIIKVLNEFDIFTDGKFNKSINRKILSIKLEIAIAERDLMAVRSNKIYRTLGMIEKLKINARVCFPKVYICLYELKKKKM